MDLSITTDSRPERCLISVCGEVDISNADALREAIEKGFALPSGEVCLDFSGVSYIDSTGIGVLVGAARRASEGETRFAVEGVQANVMRIVQLLGVDKEMDISAA